MTVNTVITENKKFTNHNMHQKGILNQLL